MFGTEAGLNLQSSSVTAGLKGPYSQNNQKDSLQQTEHSVPTSGCKAN